MTCLARFPLANKGIVQVVQRVSRHPPAAFHLRQMVELCRELGQLWQSGLHIRRAAANLHQTPVLEQSPLATVCRGSTKAARRR